MLVSFDSYYEQLNALQIQKVTISANSIPKEAVSKEAEKAMEIHGFKIFQSYSSRQMKN